jgi:hypothetical protein
MAFDTLAGGSWTAAKAPVPPAAATNAQVAGLDDVACAAPGDCVAVGNYTAPDGTSEALIETGTPAHG